MSGCCLGLLDVLFSASRTQGGWEVVRVEISISRGSGGGSVGKVWLSAFFFWFGFCYLLFLLLGLKSTVAIYFIEGGALSLIVVYNLGSLG